MEGSAPPIKDDVFCMGEKLSTGTLGAVSLALSLELQVPVSPHPTLLSSALLTLKHKVSDYKGDFVHYCFKRVDVSVADSSFPCGQKPH